MVAVPVINREGKREIWTLRRARAEFRFSRRVEHDVAAPCMLMWRGTDLFMLIKPPTGLEVRRVKLGANALESSTPIEPWFQSCEEGRPPVAIGFRGDTPEMVIDWTHLPLYRRDNPLPGVVELTEASRPRSPGGYCSPVKVRVDCHGRFSVISANSEEIWVMRFSAAGAMEKASKIPMNFAGDSKGIGIDEQGRFYYLDIEMQDDYKTPKLLHLVRLD
jgi:hypothetical protein